MLRTCARGPAWGRLFALGTHNAGRNGNRITGNKTKADTMNEKQNDETLLLFAPRARAMLDGQAERKLSARAFVADLDTGLLGVLLERLVGHGVGVSDAEDDVVVEDLRQTLALLFVRGGGLFEVRGATLTLARAVTDEVLRRIQSISQRSGDALKLPREGG